MYCLEMNENGMKKHKLVDSLTDALAREVTASAVYEGHIHEEWKELFDRLEIIRKGLKRELSNDELLEIDRLVQKSIFKSGTSKCQSVPKYSSDVNEAERVIEKIDQSGGSVADQFHKYMNSEFIQEIKPNKAIHVRKIDPLAVSIIALVAYLNVLTAKK
jgi:hypothetical protein